MNSTVGYTKLLGRENQMNFLEKFIENDLSINWTTIFMGWNGVGNLDKQLTSKEIIDYALTQVTEDMDYQSSIFELASKYKDETEQISLLLRELSNEKNNDEEIEIRKWRLLRLIEFLEQLKGNYFENLLNLTEFWLDWDLPVDGPHIIQGRLNNITPYEYYTKENYEFILNRHREWINKELDILR